MDNRIITTDVMEEDFSLEGNLRPQTLDEYIGQEKTKNTLKVYIEAAKQRHDSLDHVLFYGPPGLGKTTLSGIIANEMGVNIKITSGPAIEKPGEMAAILNNLQENDVLFVDELHRLNRQVEEIIGMEQRGELFVVRPNGPLPIRRVEKDPAKLQAVYDLGAEAGRASLSGLKEYLLTHE